MTMKLYSWDLSPYAARVRMQIYAKGLADIATEQTPFYLTQKVYEERPLSRIPSLEIDGDAIPESAVIAEYLEQIYPELANLELTDYKVRILAGSHGTGAVTRVLIESDDGTGETWSTVGVDENIIAASWHALEEAVTYCLLRSGREPS